MYECDKLLTFVLEIVNFTEKKNTAVSQCILARY